MVLLGGWFSSGLRAGILMNKRGRGNVALSAAGGWLSVGFEEGMRDQSPLKLRPCGSVYVSPSNRRRRGLARRDDAMVLHQACRLVAQRGPRAQVPQEPLRGAH